MSATVYLALGSNQGDRRAHLTSAIKQLHQHLLVEQISPVYETAPAYVTGQPPFFNLVLRGTSQLAPHALLDAVKQIEQQLGRVPTVRYGPRVIDIDILLYDQVQLAEPDLVIPHPLIAERDFVLVPLAQIAPDLVIPGLQDSVDTLAQRTGNQGMVLRMVKQIDP